MTFATRSACPPATSACCCTARARACAPRSRSISMGERRRELTCRDVVERVNDYLEGALTADELALFEQHLSSCDGCDRYVDQMRLTIETVQRLRWDDAPTGTRDELHAEFRRWKRTRRPRA